ncbi:hypothetical protein HaLaN_31418, partial [Haematococcus lacustris]
MRWQLSIHQGCFSAATCPQQRASMRLAPGYCRRCGGLLASLKMVRSIAHCDLTPSSATDGEHTASQHATRAAQVQLSIPCNDVAAQHCSLAWAYHQHPTMRAVCRYSPLPSKRIKSLVGYDWQQVLIPTGHPRHWPRNSLFGTVFDPLHVILPPFGSTSHNGVASRRDELVAGAFPCRAAFAAVGLGNLRIHLRSASNPQQPKALPSRNAARESALENSEQE